MQSKTYQKMKNQGLKSQFFHITARTKDDKYFKKSIHFVWRDCLKNLSLAYQKHPIDINGFVLMNNHYHLIAYTNQFKLQSFVGEFSPSYLENFKFEAITAKTYLYHAYKYIYQNPLRAQLVKNVEDYPYCLLHHLVQGRCFPFPIIDKFGVNDEFKLAWLNNKI